MWDIRSSQLRFAFYGCLTRTFKIVKQCLEHAWIYHFVLVHRYLGVCQYWVIFSAKDNLFCFEINTKMSCLAFINQICLPQWWHAHKWGLGAEFSFSNFTVLHASSLGTLKGLFASGTWEKGKNKQKEAGFGPCIRLVLCSSNSVNFSEFWTRIIGVAGKEAVN